MNARTELVPEGWGLGDVMRPAAQGPGAGPAAAGDVMGILGGIGPAA